MLKTRLELENEWKLCKPNVTHKLHNSSTTFGMSNFASPFIRVTNLCPPLHTWYSLLWTKPTIYQAAKHTVNDHIFLHGMYFEWNSSCFFFNSADSSSPGPTRIHRASTYIGAFQNLCCWVTLWVNLSEAASVKVGVLVLVDLGRECHKSSMEATYKGQGVQAGRDETEPLAMRYRV